MPEKFKPSSDPLVPARQLEYLLTRKKIEHWDIYELLANVATSRLFGFYLPPGLSLAEVANGNNAFAMSVQYRPAFEAGYRVPPTVLLYSHPYVCSLNLAMRAYESGIKVYRCKDELSDATIPSRFSQFEKRQLLMQLQGIMSFPRELFYDQKYSHG